MRLVAGLRPDPLGELTALAANKGRGGQRGGPGRGVGKERWGGETDGGEGGRKKREDPHNV